MSTFMVPVTLIHPDQRERSVRLDLLVDTGALYTLLPAEVVAALELRTVEDWQAQLASGERVVYPLGEVRVKLGTRERTTMFVAGPSGCPALLGALALESFGLAADPVHQRLLPVVGHL
ncbi:MAG TPA: aspartyl protease family protein [bacterium]|nr:aspartyl protease family protein [bacterium]